MMDSTIASPPWCESGLAMLLMVSVDSAVTHEAKLLQLGGDDAVWFIAQGKVDLFAAGKQETRPVVRRHLANFKANDLIFCCRSSCRLQPPLQSGDDAEDQQQELIAVPHPGTKLVRMDRSAFGRLACGPATAGPVEQTIALWVSKLLQILPHKRDHLSDIPITAGEEADLPASGLRAHVTGSLVWVNHLSGSSLLFGCEDFVLREKDVPVPLCDGSWLISTQKARVASQSTMQVLENGRFWEGMSRLHEMALRSLANEMAANLEIERTQLDRRIELDMRVFEAANVKLSAVLKPNDNGDMAVSPEAYVGPAKPSETLTAPDVHTPKKVQPGPVFGSHTPDDAASPSMDPLYAACRLVAERLGISLRFPASPSQSVPMFENLQRLCGSSHLHSRQVFLRGEWWRHDHGPLVAFFASTQHANPEGAQDCLRPVALLPSSATTYQLFDPGTGKAAVVDARMAKSLHERAFMLYAGRIDVLTGPKELLGPVIQRHWRDLLAISLMALACGLLNLLVPMVTGIIYGKIIPNGYRPELTQLALALIAAAIGACGFQITRALSVLRLTGKLDLHVQPLVWGRLLALPVSFFRRFTVGDLADRIQGIVVIRQLLLTDVTTTALALVTSVTSFALLFYYSWRLALLASGLVASLAAMTAIVARLQLKHRRRALEARGKISSLAFALLQGLAKLRSSGAEMRSYGVWAGQFAEQGRHALQAQRMASLQASLNAFYIVGSELALFALMGSSLRKHLSLGGFLAFSAAFGQVQAALLTFISLIPGLLVIFPIYKRLQPVLNAAAEEDETRTSAELSGDIEVQNISFRYHEQGPLVLDNVSFKACRGEFIAIVGPSGSGKSTLVRLLLGFECPTSGSILYDKLNLELLDVKSVRRQIGTVLQNSKPIAGDIFSNIVGGTNRDLDSAWEAARIASIDEEIRGMPMGMHTLIGEGATTFSGGERQRLMIARAVVNRPRIILFDEATSALDNPTQDKIQQCLEQMSATRIVIAHRLSTIRHADRIYVLDGGRIVEKGSYEDLCKRGGRFAQMVLRQI